MAWIPRCFLLLVSSSMFLSWPSVVEGLPDGKALMCYVAQWSLQRGGPGKFSMEDIDPYMCTHLVYAYTSLDEKTSKISSDGCNNAGSIEEIIRLKKINPFLQILVSIGGWMDGSVKYSNMTADPRRRTIFVDSVMEYLKENNFDGLDLAWAYPGARGGKPADKRNLVLLLKELRKSFDRKKYILTIQLNPQKYFVDTSYDVAEISKYVHYMNLATHYYNNPWGGKTGPNAPLSTPDDSNIVFSIDYVIEKGGAPNKMLLGFPTYGVPYQLVDEPAAGTRNYMSLPVDKKVLKGPFTNEEGLVAYYEICEDMTNNTGWSEHWDDESSTPFAINGKKMYAYDNVRSFNEKLKYVTGKGLGGSTVWWLDTDDFSGKCSGNKFPLVNTISSYFNKTNKENVGGNVLMCYVAQWSIYRRGVGQFSMPGIDPYLCTHLVYAYAGLNGTSYELTSRDRTGEDNLSGKGLLATITGLKKVNPSLKVLVSVGGWSEGSTNYSNMVATQPRRAAFIISVLDYLKRNNFDGLDLAWAYPADRGGVREDKENLVQLFKEMRESFNPDGYLITVQMKAERYFIDNGYDMPRISKYVDYINMATHYYNHPWSGRTGANAPLNSTDELNSAFSVRFMIEKGGDPKKMLLGLPTYGVPHQFLRDPTGGRYMSLPTTKEVLKGPFTNEDGLVAYYEICLDLKNPGWSELWDEDSSTPFAVKGRKLYSYDNQISYKAKLEMVRREGLGGVVVWWLDTDDFAGACGGYKYPLIRYIKDFFSGAIQEGSPVSGSSFVNVSVVSHAIE